jgi:hypothetical protein
MPRRTVVLAALLLAVAPSGAAAATWSAPQALTRSGAAFSPAVANGTNGGVAVAYLRQLGGASRVELRNGTLSGSLRAPVVLDSSTHAIFDPAVAINFDGRSVVAWRRFFEGNHRVRATSVRRDGHVGPVQRLSGGGESAYEPVFLPSADGQTYLGWPRRTFGQFVPFANGAFQPFVSSPGAAIGNSPVAAVDSTGTIVLVWTSGGQVLTATGRPGGAFSAPAKVLAAPGGDPRITVLPDGTVVAAWTTAAGVVAATRPPGGDFGAPVTVVGTAVSDAQIIASAAGEVMVAYVDGARHLLLQRLTPALARVGTPFDLGAGAETLGVALARDNSAVFASWTERSSGAIHVRRLAPGGILGTVRTIVSRSVLRGHPPATAAGAVAWVNGGGTLLMSRYR